MENFPITTSQLRSITISQLHSIITSLLHSLNSRHLLPIIAQSPPALFPQYTTTIAYPALLWHHYADLLNQDLPSPTQLD